MWNAHCALWVVFASILAGVFLIYAGFTVYCIWYAKSGRYELDRRLDAATK